jgi:hypothetical protein
MLFHLEFQNIFDDMTFLKTMKWNTPFGVASWLISDLEIVSFKGILNWKCGSQFSKKNIESCLKNIEWIR